MKSQYAWFLPMLEVIMAPKAAEKRGSLFLRRLKSSIMPAAPSDVVEDPVADEESGFSSVVRLGAHGPHTAVRARAASTGAQRLNVCVLRCQPMGEARHHRFLRMPMWPSIRHP